MKLAGLKFHEYLLVFFRVILRFGMIVFRLDYVAAF